MPLYNYHGGELVDNTLVLGARPHEAEEWEPEQERHHDQAPRPVIFNVNLDEQEQRERHYHILGVLNLRFQYRTDTNDALLEYIQRYGPLSSASRFGEHHWLGLMTAFKKYAHRRLAPDEQVLELAWVLIPSAFSTHQAKMPPQPGDYRYYPAVIWEDGSELARMACQHIIEVHCRPWWVHVERIYCRTPFMNTRQYYVENHVGPRRYQLISQFEVVD